MGENSFKARTGQLGPGWVESSLLTQPQRRCEKEAAEDRRTADNGRDIVISNAGMAGGKNFDSSALSILYGIADLAAHVLVF